MAEELEVREIVRAAAHPLTGGDEDYDALLDRIGDARVVLIGEASHGTHEFYEERARLTRRLIEERGVDAVAVEGDWPDCDRIGRFVRGRGQDRTATEALGEFHRYPRWMWRNTVVRDFVAWLRAANDARPEPQRAGFYGLDLYSMHASIDAVVAYLDQVDPEGARRARERYACLTMHGDDPQLYGYAARIDPSRSCEDEVVAQLVDLRARGWRILEGDGADASDRFFSAEQNARLARDAERYYRAMFGGRVSSWNIRDEHMMDTLEHLLRHLDAHHPDGRARVVVWAHNSHLGDARATAMADRGELNLGQLVRERFGRDAFSVGFTTYEGTVTCSTDWDGPVERKQVRPGLPGSWEALFHQVARGGGRQGDGDLSRFLLDIRRGGAVQAVLEDERIERAIGVIYRPETERVSHYFGARIGDQFDAVVHVDQTRALEPLDRTSGWERGELPDTYPFGI